MIDVGGKSAHASPIQLKKGNQTYRKRVKVEIMNEYKQLHNLTVFELQELSPMSLQEWYRWIQVVNSIKEQRCGKIQKEDVIREEAPMYL